MKKESGITLIALIITIIVLIILAMVSVGIIINQNIIGHAENAAETYTVEQEKELIDIAYSNYKLETYTNSITPVETTEDYEELETYFLGEDKQGLTIAEFINLAVEEDDEQIQFSNGIIFNKNEIIQNQGGVVEAWFFDYNGFRYKLLFNNVDNNTTGTLRLEIVGKIPTLEVQDAVVEGDEKQGWKITFNKSKNVYTLAGSENN